MTSAPHRSRNLEAVAVAALIGLAVAGGGPAFAQQGSAKAATPRQSASPLPSDPVTTPAGPAGFWLDHTGRGAVEIQPCGTQLCGRIVWLQQPLDKKGQPLRDTLNENTKLRSRPICGLQIIGELKPMRDGSWDGGWIYDPEQGERFDVELRLQRDTDLLQVKGYKGIKFLSETYQWRRMATPPAPVCQAPGPV